MKTRTTLAASVAAALLTSAVMFCQAPVARAAEVRWNAGGGNFLWSGPNWEDTGGAPHAAPVAGDRVVFDDNYTPGGNCGIDMAGAMIDLGTGSLGHGYGGRNWSFYDSATLTPNNNPLANPTDFNLGAHASLEAASSASALLLKVKNSDWSKSGTPRFFLPVEITGTFKTPEAGTLEFYGPAKINYHAEPRNKGWNSKLHFRNSADITTMDVIFRNGVDGEDAFFYGTTNIGTLNQDGGEVFFEATSTVTIGTLNFTRGAFVTKVLPTITTTNWTGGTWVAAANGALPSAAPFSLGAGQVLRLDAVQTSLPVVTVGADAGLGGNMTNVVYSGAGQNVIFQNNAIHAPNPEAVPALQASDLGAGVGVWRGVTSFGGTAVWQAGLVGTSPYKGLALDSNYVGGDVRGTFSALPGSGDLLVKVNSGFRLPNSTHPKWNGDGTSTTAQFMMGPRGSFNMLRHFNQDNTAAGRILTFDLTRAPGNELGTIISSSQQPGVFADQDLNVTGGTISINAFVGRLKGDLTLTNGAWNVSGIGDFAAADTGTMTLAGRTVMNLPNGDSVNNDFLEALDSRFSYSGLPMATFSDRNGGPWIYTFDLDQTAAGTAPLLAQFLASVDYGSNHYHDVDIGGDGLLIGDGKFLSDAGTTNATDEYQGHGGAKIMPGQPGAITMGFAAIAKNLAIDIPVDAPDATVQVGTTDPNRLITYGGPGFTPAGVPTKKVTFLQSVTAKGVKVESGTAQFNQDLVVDTLSVRTGATLTMAGGKTATVNQLLSGGGTYGGGNGVVLAPGAVVAPGDSVGTLNGNTLVMQSGAGYQWEVADPDGTPGTGWDLVDVDSLTFEGPWMLEVLDAGLTRPVEITDEFTLFTAGVIGGTFQLEAGISVPPGWDKGSAVVTQRGNDLILTGLKSGVPGGDVDIPEPATMAALALALAGLGGYIRKRKQQA